MIKKDKENKEIDLKDRMKYINKEYNINIIEIKEEDNIKDYIQLDDNCDNVLSYFGKTIYILDNKISYGKIKEIEENNFKYECYLENNIKGLPIINIKNNKLIGINGTINNNGIFLKNSIEEFINIREFNKKFNLNITDINLQKLSLESKSIKNEELQYLENINFVDLKELCLASNHISDIKVLENVKFNKLEKLDISGNKITNIDILKKVNFTELKELILNNNNILDIKVLEKVKFNKLEKLYLGKNKISNINNQIFCK